MTIEVRVCSLMRQSRLDAEQRITYLNQFMRQVAALATEEVATAPYEMEWLLAA